jgi:hypothetical protein
LISASRAVGATTSIIINLVPRVHGGSDDDSNMVTYCRECHGKAHNADWSLDHVELVKAGWAKVRERTAADWKVIARQKRRQAAKAAEMAAAIAKEAEEAEAEATAAQDQGDIITLETVEPVAIDSLETDVSSELSEPVAIDDSVEAVSAATEKPKKDVPLTLVADNPEKLTSDAPKPSLRVVLSPPKPPILVEPQIEARPLPVDPLPAQPSAPPPTVPELPELELFIVPRISKFMIGRESFQWEGDCLYHCRKRGKHLLATIKTDGGGGMWRIHLPDGSTSADTYNRTRAKEHAIKLGLMDLNKLESKAA